MRSFSFFAETRDQNSVSHRHSRRHGMAPLTKTILIETGVPFRLVNSDKPCRDTFSNRSQFSCR